MLGVSVAIFLCMQREPFPRGGVLPTAPLSLATLLEAAGGNAVGSAAALRKLPLKKLRQLANACNFEPGWMEPHIKKKELYFVISSLKRNLSPALALELLEAIVSVSTPHK